MRKLLRKLILWALAAPAAPSTPNDAAGMDKLIRDTRSGR